MPLCGNFGGWSSSSEPMGTQRGGCPSGRGCDVGTGAIPDLLGSAGVGLFASTRPVLLWANYLRNAFLILREIT